MSDEGTPVLIHWVIQGVSVNENGEYSSPLASNRYRAIYPAQALCDAGHEAEIIQASSWRAEYSKHASAVVIGKLLPSTSVDQFRLESEQLLAEIVKCKEFGVSVIADFCDDHFDHPVIGPFWRDLAGHANTCVAPSKAMANVIGLYSTTPVIVIGDPIGSPAGFPKVPPVFKNSAQGVLRRFFTSLRQNRITLCWYGSPGNWPPMKAWLNQLLPLAKDYSLLFKVVTKVSTELKHFVEQFNKQHHPHVAIELIEWCEDVQWDAVWRSDIVLVPSDEKNQKNAVKSTNRVVDALNAGRIVVASPLPEYLSLSAWIYLAEDPASAIDSIIKNAPHALVKLKEGQDFVRKKYGLRNICDLWIAAVRSLISQPVPQSTVAAPSLQSRQKLSEDLQKSTSTTKKARTLIIISYWAKRSKVHLVSLLAQLATAPVDILVVANTEETDAPLRRHELPGRPLVLIRPNEGMNIGAWDAGWRNCRDYESYIFLQDECYIKNPNFLQVYQRELESRQIGLLGESYNFRWDRPWAELKISPLNRKNHNGVDAPLGVGRVDFYLQAMAAFDVNPGDSGGHLRSLVWAARLDVLEVMNGFNYGHSRAECIAGEIAAAKKLEFLGYQCRQFSSIPFSSIGHREWRPDGVGKVKAIPESNQSW